MGFPSDSIIYTTDQKKSSNQIGLSKIFIAVLNYTCFLEMEDV